MELCKQWHSINETDFIIQDFSRLKMVAEGIHRMDLDGNDDFEDISDDKLVGYAISECRFRRFWCEFGKIVKAWDICDLNATSLNDALTSGKVSRNEIFEEKNHCIADDTFWKISYTLSCSNFLLINII
jgi:hypothetical protein